MVKKIFPKNRISPLNPLKIRRNGLKTVDYGKLKLGKNGFRGDI